MIEWALQFVDPVTALLLSFMWREIRCIKRRLSQLETLHPRTDGGRSEDA